MPQLEQHPVVETPALIIGAGPAGGSLACFLSHPPYSIKGLMISTAPATSQTPRAHIVNPAAMECLRDIGLEQECIKTGTSGDNMMHTRWCHDMTGEEYARIYSWGNDPKRKGEYEDATPCRHMDLPQTALEPILVQRAMADGWDVRFSVTFVRFEEDENGVTSFLRDNITKSDFVVRSKYLFGCDGARSAVLRQLGVPLIAKPGQGLALNVLVKVDLTEFVEARKGNLHWVFQPEQPYADFAWCGLVRMVKPWDDIVGNDDLPIDILDVSKWYINEIIAEYYSQGSIFCLGDAVHRHPPFNGLGSNTCIQDAFNLAWKVKLVERGVAGRALLDTYSLERQPVGHGVVTRANQGIRDHLPVWHELGLLEKTPEERVDSMRRLSDATREARERRKRLYNALESTSHEFHALGIEMNHRYTSTAIISRDEKPNAQPPKEPQDPILHHSSSTWPGSRLPHAWLNTRIPQQKHTSTIDLAGHGVFCLLTGIGGGRWKEAAWKVGQDVGLEIRAYSIGWGQDYEDIYRDWERKREVTEQGCVLIRPDRYVACRSMDMVGDCEDWLRSVLVIILGAPKPC
ncbi:hypothetical protein FE257_005777 [Aspergillus nanangensis]|uniref:FAD-binding domain-containing protein n=1 Tax=Aspergillus nanangensis TaxID=2582783 RepID=A0AAD4CQ92_ASPNN|nr:hypothetical protein FE257_005777 [Aspergillus nanangensis]